MKKNVWNYFADRITAACERSGKSMAAVARDAGVTTETLRLWRRGKAFPNAANWEALADALGVSVDYLLRPVVVIPLGAVDEWLDGFSR